MTITDLRDAKFLRSIGEPLTTPVKDGGELPASTDKAVKEGFKAAIAFRKSIFAWCINQNASTFAAMDRAFERFMRKTESDDEIGAAILDSEFGAVRAEWSDIFEALYAGEPIQIGAGICWPWEPTEATKRRLANPEM